MKKRRKLLFIVLPVVVIVSVLLAGFIPVSIPVSITGEGNLSLQTRVALAVGNPSVDNPSEQIYEIGEEELVESIWRRTKNSKVFHSYGIPNRDYHDIYLDAIHYEVGHDRIIEELEGPETIYWTTWEDIDNSLEPAVAPWNWQMVEADYHVYILEDFTYSQILKFEKADPYGTVLGNVAFQPMALQWTNDLDQIQQVSMPQSGVLSVADNKIQWDSAYGQGIDFSWICSSTRLVKLITVSSLSDLPTPEQFILDGNNPVLELNLIFDPSSDLDIYVDGTEWAQNKPTTDTFGTIEFKLGEETLWGFMPLWVWDSSGENELQVFQRIRKVGNKLYVSVRVPYDWIQSATYPIYIDAVVDESVETSPDDAHEVVSDGSIDLTDTIIDLGYYTGGPTHAGFRFTGVDTTDVENVSTAYLEFYPASADTGIVSYTWYGEDIASATTFTTDTYNISGRDRTTASVTENPPAGWIKDTWVQTEDLSNILNEIFSRGDWVSGNDLAILCIYGSGSGERRLRSWDYNDHSYAPKLHFENPTEVTYYFNVGSVPPAWETNPSYMVDNILTNFASTASTDDAQQLTGNTCPGIDLGTITKVELRAYGHGDGDDRIDLTSYFSGRGYGDEHELTMPSSANWSVYIDITNDTNAPSPWTWTDIVLINIQRGPPTDGGVVFTKVGKGNTMYCSKVEIRVTYWSPPVSDIDVGAEPLDRASYLGWSTTYIDKNNPANASGTLHTVKVFAYANISGLIVGTFYPTNGLTFKCRDSEAIGAVEAGAERTFTELSITVEVGDYIGCYYTGGNIENSDSGFSGVWYVVGEYIDPNDETTYALYAGEAMSLYGYGDIGAEADISNAPTSKAFGVVDTSTTYWSNGSEPTWPLVDGDAYFTVTNNGGVCSITVEATNFTGGVGWTLGTPGENTVRLTSFKEGDGSGDGVTLTTSPQAFISGLATNIDWELKFETATSHTDGAGKTSILTLTATLD